jgi:hypothetical protein
MVKTAPCRLRNRRKIQPKKTLRGRDKMDKPARYGVPVSWARVHRGRAAAQRVVGVDRKLDGLTAVRREITLTLAKWQVTAAGSDAQPIPMLASAKPLIEVSVTATVAFCPVCSHGDAGGTDGEIEAGRRAGDRGRLRCGRTVDRGPRYIPRRWCRSRQPDSGMRVATPLEFRVVDPIASFHR